MLDEYFKMTALARGRFAERILAIVSGCALVLGMATLDDSVREFVANALKGEPSSDLVMVGARTQQFAGVLKETVGSYGTEHGILVLFAAGALVLVAFMWRT